MAEIFNNRVISTVQTKMFAKVVDTVLNSNVFLQRQLSSAKKWSGRTMRPAVKTSKNTTGGSFRGLDTLSVAATDNRQIMEYTPCNYQMTVTLPGDELAIADTDEKVIDLMAAEVQSTAEDMADDMGTLAYLDGTGNGGKDFLGLAALVDDGTSVATIGGLSRATYTTLQSTVTASSGTLTAAKVDTLWNAVTSGMQKPTTGYTTEAIFSFYGQLLRPQEQIMKNVSGSKTLVGSTGFTGLEYKGVGIVADEKCTSGVLFLLNENFIDWYALPSHNGKALAYKDQIDGNDYDTPVGLGFSSSGWLTPVNADGVINHIIVRGNFITTNPKRSGKLTGITGI